jgi:hypothetical protein
MGKWLSLELRYVRIVGAMSRNRYKAAKKNDVGVSSSSHDKNEAHTSKEQLGLQDLMHHSTAIILYTLLYRTIAHVKTQVRNGKDSNQALEALLACQVLDEGVERGTLGISAGFETFVRDD